MLIRIHRFAVNQPNQSTTPSKFRSILTPVQRKLHSVEAIKVFVDQLVKAGLADWEESSSPRGRPFRAKGIMPGA
jgi:hypothetical protein